MANPFLQGWYGAQQAADARFANQVQGFGGLLQLQEQMQMAPLKRMQIEAALDAGQRKQEVMAQYAAQLPEGERAAFMLSPDTFIKERFAPYTLKPGEQRFVGGSSVAGLPEMPKLEHVPVPGQPGVTQAVWLRPGETTGPSVGAPKLPEILNPLVQQAKLQVAQAGRPVTNVSVNTGKTFGESMGREFGAMIPQLRGEASGALDTIRASHQIQGAIDSGEVMAGPAATLRLRGSQVANMLGFTGPEAIVKTRETIQGLSKLALGARQALKGQGQITEYEQKLLEKAEAGNIDDLTIPEIRTIAQVADKAGRLKIRSFNEMGGSLAGSPEYDPLRQFFNVQEPPAYVPRRRTTDRPQGGFRVLSEGE